MRKAKPIVYNDELPSPAGCTDSEKAQSWYAQAAIADNNPEQAKLCALYSKKSGVDWYFDAAFRGDIYAMYALGKMYCVGAGVDQNYTKAAIWFSKASEAGIAYADYEFAKACKNGQGLDEDQEYADILFKKAFRALSNQEKRIPDIHSEYILATMYEHGLGISKDLQRAEYWRNIAINGYSESKNVLEPDKNQDEITAEIQKSGSELTGPDEICLIPEKLAELPDTSAVEVPPESNSNPSPIPNKGPKEIKEPPFQPKVIPLKRGTEKPKKTVHRKIRTSKENPVPQKDDAGCEDFLSMITPSVIDFQHTDFFVCGNTFRSVWAIREYPAETGQLAILRDLGEKSGITLHVYLRPVSAAEEDKIIKEAERRNHHKRLNARSEKDRESADWNMQDVRTLISHSLRDKETLMHCSVFFELIASSYEGLQKLQNEVRTICTRAKFVFDILWLRQQEGFTSVMPVGSNQFGQEFERVIPTSSVGNLYPFSYSGKTDKHGMYIGEDVNGTNIILDFDARSESKTNGHIIILGNSGEGKSYLTKLIITNKRQLGKKIYIIDVDNEYSDPVNNLGGCNLDMMAGKYFINVLEPRFWTDNPVTTSNDEDSKSDFIPISFRQTTRLSQHIAYLRDFFSCYKDFPTEQLDTLEVLLEKLYIQFHITDKTDFSQLKPENYPILSDLFKLAEAELETYDKAGNQLYTKDVLRSLTLGLRSICVGAESRFFNGYTNITNSDFINFGVAGVLDTNENLKNAMFMNIFSWMSHKFLTEGDTDLILDEYHEFVKNKIVVNYTRSFMKRGRKRDSDVIIDSQNVEDLLLPGIVEYTKPLFSIPTHSFLFNPGQNVNVKEFQRALNVPDSEWELIKNPRKGHCLFRSGNERYHLHVIAPEYKSALFGKAGGL